MFAMFRTRKPRPPAFPFSSHPAIFSIITPLFMLWIAILKAYVFSCMAVLTEWRPESASEGGASELLMFSLWLDHPWQALLGGCLIGAVMTLGLNHYEWKHAGEIAKLRVAQRRWRFEFSCSRHFDVRLAAVLAAVGTLVAVCYALQISVDVAVYGLFIAQFLSYRVNRRIYGLAKPYYAEAMEAAGGAAGPLGPSRAQKISYAALATAMSACLIVLTVYVIRSAPMMNELDLSLQRAAGSEMTADQAVVLEERLAGKREDLRARARLIGYYESLHAKSQLPEAATQLRRQYLWFIEHHPESFVECPTEFSPKHNGGDTAPLLEAERLWQKQIALYSENASVLSNAADFFSYAKSDLPQAIELMKRCVDLEPSNDDWRTRLSYLRAVEQREKTSLLQ